MPGPRFFQAIPTVTALALAVSVGPAGCRKTPPEPPEATATRAPTKPYLARRHAHDTELRVRGPSPGKYEEYRPARGVSAVTYPSGDLSLVAWYATPLGASGSNRAPALVYFHGDFAFGPDDFESVRPFVDAGYVVMTPMLRGENGNPGDFELLWGEVDDARAAIEWIASQPMVDRHRIYAFGHSIGGGVAAMLSLYPSLPLRMSASCGGIYMPETFARWAASGRNAELVRFDAEDAEETELRTLGPNLAWMVHRHIAYVGADDPWFVDNAAELERRAWELGKPFERVVVAGDHMASLQPALAAFLVLTQRDQPPR
ncbi:alpha/beta hydrolase family protein [Enhygromyxa salina]|uniref:Alpha/beta hydrolase family protein n=1 Tax=Enhygromyxa salina TaxID=215803 RepID=A0A2S9YWX8_9BACT|nr:CocE/NonD family hydrolase [Enhygromyxa salina]PRQ09583.1 Alpha/beta hydrolase family protein [Enhygromyxa salina]